MGLQGWCLNPKMFVWFQQWHLLLCLARSSLSVMPELLASLSRDQKLLFQLGMAVQTGIFAPEIASATIGPPLHARWLTTGARDLRYI